MSNARIETAGQKQTLAKGLKRPKTAARNVWFSPKIRRKNFVKTGMNTLSSNSCDVVYNLLKLW